MGETRPHGEGPIRVLHAIDSLRVGGAQLLLGGLLDELARDPSVESHLLVAGSRGTDPELLETMASRTVSLRLVDSRRLADPHLLGAVFAELRRIRPAVVHSHLIDANVTTRVGARSHRIPHLATIHIPPFPLADSGRARTLADGLTARLSTRLVAVSEHAADAYARAFRLRRSRISVVPNAAIARPARPEFDREATRAELGADPGTPLIACVSRLESHKGIGDLIGATSLLRERLPAVRVVVAGSGSEAEALSTRAAAQGLNGSFGLLGNREDIGEVLAAADVFCMPSHHEGSPISLIEAMHAGLPCVVTTAGGMPEMVVDGESGVVLEPGDRVALAAALESLIRDPRRATDLGRRAARIAAETYTPRAMTARYRRIYEELA